MVVQAMSCFGGSAARGDWPLHAEARSPTIIVVSTRRIEVSDCSLTPRMSDVDAIVIGGGPAGAAAARLLSLWGHAVRLLTKAPDTSRGAAESLPPSTRKLLATIGVLDRVEQAGFYRTTGNTVWWGERHGDVERFDASADGGRGDAAFHGYQVLRPGFDRLMLNAAADAGAGVTGNIYVQRVHLPEPGSAAG